MNVRIYFIPDVIVSIVDTRLRLPTKTLLKGMQAVGKRKIQIRLPKSDWNIKFHLYSLKVTANVKIAVQCCEIFEEPFVSIPPLVARL